MDHVVVMVVSFSSLMAFGAFLYADPLLVLQKKNLAVLNRVLLVAKVVSK